MIIKNGSFSVEAALIAPMLLGLTIMAINAGIHMRQEAVEYSLQFTNQKKTDIIQCLYYVKCMENLIGEIYGD